MGGSKKNVMIAIIIVLVVVTVLNAHTYLTKATYSVGYQMAPHYLGPTEWTGTPYVM